MAYTNSDIKEGRGCAIWLGDLLDIRQFSAGGQDLYIRMHASEFGMYVLFCGRRSSMSIFICHGSEFKLLFLLSFNLFPFSRN
jgi:hypothetical protein